ncbi:MAG: chemotaxis protein CheB [Anaerolineae bacterium]|jgi:two-component system CheB/CheR fusion protein
MPDELKAAPDGETRREDAAREVPEQHQKLDQTKRRPTRSSFAVVGIGASAGGLEPLEEFFSHVPPNSGIAYVVVQHMSPPHRSALAELLGRNTSMPVVEATQGQQVEPDHVYVIPPGCYLSISDSVLTLTAPEGERAPRNTFDLFFRSLAAARREEAIGVILSGSGTDGTLGIRAIKGEGGLVVVQDPSTAEHDGMPTSAIVTGLVDLVLPVAQMPDHIIDYVHNERRAHRLKSVTAMVDPLRRLLALVHAQTGVDFSHYKQTTVVRRVQRRMAIRNIANLLQYVQVAQEEPRELQALFRELLINVTSFFRDPEAFQALATHALPRLFSRRQPDETLRVWVPACSTGEEAYSIAIIIQEYLDRVRRPVLYQIFATDLDAQAIETARAGIYPQNIAVDVSQERLARFFLRESHAFRIRQSIRDQIVFAVHNALQDPPFSRVDLISCRNLLIYLDTEAQYRLLHLFHYSLTDDGVLFLGPSETVGDSTYLFTPLDKKWRIFLRSGSVPRPASLRTVGIAKITSAPAVGASDPKTPTPFSTKRPEAQRDPGLRSAAERALLDTFAPPAVITDESGRIVYFHGRTGKYLEPTPGEPRLNVLSMAREGLAGKLSAAFQEAVRERREVTVSGVRLLQETGTQELVLTVKPFRASGEGRDLFMVVFQDVPSPRQEPASSEAAASPEPRIARLEEELRAARDEVRNVTEQLGTANEELQSANEELLSANEELQSSSEELVSSHEELQSLNEELQTVNAELRVKVEDLSQANDDMTNLLTSTGIGSLVLDEALRVKRYTPAVSEIIKLIPSDIGRPITDITSNLHYDRLAEAVATTLRTLAAYETQVQTTDGRWFTMRVLPYRTVDNVIDGVLITFSDATATVEARRMARAMREAVQHSADASLITDSEGRIEYANPRASEVLGRAHDEIVGSRLKDLGWADRDPESYQRLWNAVAAGKPWQGIIRAPGAAGTTRILEVSATPVLEPDGANVAAVTLVVHPAGEQ